MHVVVLLHGLLGTPSHMDYIKKTLLAAEGGGRPKDPPKGWKTKRNAPGKLSVLVPDCNSGWLTYDGIDVCSRRALVAVLEHLDALEKDGTPATALSVIGYSLGGLIGRHLIGQLLKQDVFSARGIEPRNFVTLATPHLGILRAAGSGIRSRLLGHLASAGFASRSGLQLVFGDSHVSGLPLLQLMATPGSVYHAALGKFQNLVLYVNTINDRTVPFWSSFMVSDGAKAGDSRTVDDVLDRRLVIGPGWNGSIVASFGAPVDLSIIKSRPVTAENALEAAAPDPTSTLHSTTPMPPIRRAFFFALLPVFVIVAAGTTLWQSYHSRSRISREPAAAPAAGRPSLDLGAPGVAGDADVDKPLPPSPTLSPVVDPETEEAERKKVLEDIEAIPAGGEEQPPMDDVEKQEVVASDARAAAVLNDVTSEPSFSIADTSRQSERSGPSFSTSTTSKQSAERTPNAPVFLPPVAATPRLTNEQVEASRGLNQLSWTKVPVKIDHFRSHACIVARSAEFEVGWGVVEHLVWVGMKW